MKRISLLIGAGAICCASYAHATPYVGADLHLRSTSIVGSHKGLFNTKPKALNVHLGKMLDETFAIETGYKFSKSIKNKARLEIKSLHGSLVAYLPILDTKGLSLLGGIGIAATQHKAEHKTYNLQASGCIPRFMAGMEYSFVPNLAARFAFDWENAKALTKADKRFNNVYGLSAGLKYSFI